MAMHICILFLYGGDMKTCLRALATELIPIMSELLHVLEASGEPREPESQGNSATHYCTVRAKHSAMTHRQNGLALGVQH